MKSKSSMVALGLSVAALLLNLGVCAGDTIVVPRENENLDGSATDGGGSGVLREALRHQAVYHASHFPTGLLTISEIRMRPSATTGGAFSTTISNLQVTLSTTLAQPDNLSATLSSNLGPDSIVVYDGSLAVSSAFTGPSGGTKDFDIIIPLDVPFAYDTSKGNLLVETRNFFGAAAATHADAGGLLNDKASRAFVLNPNGTTATTRDKAAEVLQLVYTLESPCVVPDGLVAWWRAEGDAMDSVGTNHGDPVGGLGFAPGKVGQTYAFDGSSSYIRLPASASLNIGLGSGLTIEGWIQPTAAALYGWGAPIIEWDSATTDGLQLWVGSGYLFANVKDTAGVSHTLQSAAGIVATNVMQHVALTYDKGSGLAAIHLNGQIVASRLIGSVTPQTTYPVNIGRRTGQPIGLNQTFGGLIDELSLYNRAFGTNEIAAIYAAGSAGKCIAEPPPSCDLPHGLVSWWRAEDNALDSAGTNHANLVGNTTYGVGRVGQGMVFDGSGDGAPIGNPTNLHLQNLTIESWVKRGSTSTASLGSGGNGVIFGGGWGSYLLYFDAPGRLVFNKLGDGPTYGPIVADTNFHHVAVTKVGSTVTFYLDGVSYPAANITSTFTFTTSMGIGFRPDNQDNSFLGTVDELSVYNRALASNEIAAIYQTGSAGKCVPQLPQPCVSPDDVVAWWRCEGNGFDQVGTNHATLVGSTTYGVGRVGQGMVFDGSGDGAPIGNPTNLHLQDLTIETWVRRGSTSTASFGTGGNGVIFGGGWGSYLFYLDTAGRLRFNKLGDIAPPPGPLVGDTNFHHVAVTKVGSTVTFYLDGVAYPAAPITSSFTFSTSLAIGYRPDNQDNSFLGTIDEMSVYDRALGSNEIAAIYQAGSVGKCPPTPPEPCVSPDGIVAWWRAENNAMDSIGTNHGTFPFGSAYASGTVGQAFDFDGVSRVVHVPNAPALNPTNAITLESWVYITSYSANDGVAVFGKDGVYSERQYMLGLGDRFRQGLTNVPNSWVFRAHLSVPGQFKVMNGTTVIQTGAWYHVAMTYDGAALNLYVNGKLDASEPLTGPIITTLQPLIIGGSVPGPWDFNGRVDELSLYNRALGTNEIAAIYAAGSTGKCLPVAVAPVIIQHPAGQTAVVGDAVTFGVTATGSTPLSYQWRWNGNPIAGSTNSVLTLNAVQLANAGNYSVIVSNAAGIATSSNALLTVLVPDCTPAPAGLVAWWQANGDNSDSVGANSAIILGGDHYATGKVGLGFEFQSYSNYARIAESPALNVGVSEGFTVEGWILPKNVAGFHPIWEWYDGDTRGAVGPHLWLGRLPSSNGELFANIVGADGSSHGLWSGNGVVAANVLQHVALTYDKASGVGRLLLNGAIVAEANFGSFTPRTDRDVYLGHRPADLPGDWTYNAWFDGVLDEFSLYNRALTTNEIAAIYAARGEGKCSLPPIILAVTPPGALVNEGENVTFAASATGSPPLSYQWQFNGDDLAGATNATLTLSNVLFAQAGDYTVVVSGPGGTASSNAVLAVNRAPIANAAATEKLIISLDCFDGSNVVAVLDGSLSSDPDGDALTYEWFRLGEDSPFATGVVAVTTLPLGTNQLKLVVNDGMASSVQIFAVEVILTSEAVERLAQLVQSGNSQSLTASLRAALASIDRCQPDVAINQLETFKNKVQAQVMPVDPELAEQLLADAQAIIDALNGGATTAETPIEITSIRAGNNGKPHLSIRGRANRTHVVETSTNLADWTPVGVATGCGDCEFEFEDVQSAPSGARFYRVVSPK